MIQTNLQQTKIKYLIYSDENQIVDMLDPEQFYQLLYTQLKLNLLKDGRDPNKLEFNFGESTRFCPYIFSGSDRKKDLDILIEKGVLESVSKIRYKLL